MMLVYIFVPCIVFAFIFIVIMVVKIKLFDKNIKNLENCRPYSTINSNNEKNNADMYTELDFK